MMRSVVVAVLVTILSADSVHCASQYGGSLRLVNAVFRHGQRTPADTYPKDPHIKHDFHPYGWGQLTNEGKVQQYELGKFLRGRYGEFLGDQFSTELVSVQSTDVDRTLMSAQLVAAGLFPPTDLQQWNPDLSWQPVPVHSQPLNQDTLLLVRTSCPRYHEVLDEVKATGEVYKYLSSLSDLYADLSKYSGLTIKDPDDVQSLYSTMLAEVQFNLTIPEWTTHYFPKAMKAVTAYSFTLNAYNDELKKLKGGPLLKKILQDMETKSLSSQSKQKLYLYAGHDSTIANILSALKVWDEQVPVYNILAMIELHQVNSVYGIKVFLRNSTEDAPFLLRVPGCEDFCPLDKITDLTTNVLPENLQEECLSHNSSYIAPPASGP